MKYKVHKTPLVRKNICLNLFGTYWSGDPSWIGPATINHERIHDAQQRELLYIPFYILYLLEWFVKLLIYRNSHTAYRNISFEREAYRHGDDFGYLRRRRPYAWRHFLSGNRLPANFR